MNSAIEYALGNIPGWTAPGDLEYLASAASKSPRIAEVGSWRGRSTYVLAKSTPGMVYAIDTWAGSAEHKEELAAKPKDWLFLDFKNNMSGVDNITVSRTSSLVAASQCFEAGLKLDMIFIDASHDYAGVRADIVAWLPNLREGGIMCGHDYDPGWPGVKQAVHELIPKFRVPTGSTIWTTEE